MGSIDILEISKAYQIIPAMTLVLIKVIATITP
jgi:hypothetical protein